MSKSLTAAFLCLVLGAGGSATAQQLGTIRFDNWLSFQENADNSELWQYQARWYLPFDLSGGWIFTQRIDVPASYTDQVGTDNPAGGWKGRMSNVFIEEIFTTPELARNFRMWASVRFVFPTGGSAPFGTPQYQWAPAVSATYDIPDHGITINPVARYYMSFHATEPGSTKIRQLWLYPIVTFAMAHDWSLVSYAENGISYDEVSKNWYVPIELMLTKRLGKTVELGLGIAYAPDKGLDSENRLYKYNVYARASFYF